MPPRKTRTSKGILGVPRRAERQVFVFGRYAEALPSDESDDPDFNPGDEEKPKTKSGERKKKNNAEGCRSAKKRKLGRKQTTKSSTLNQSTDVGNDTAESCDLSRGWSDLIPVEILLLIFQHALEQLGCSSIPFLCRMSRVCRRWREVASEPRLWRSVNLSTTVLNITSSAAILQKLAPVRLKYTRELFLRGWSKLTDKGLEALGRHCQELQHIYLSQCESLTSQGIASLADKCRHITSIDLESTKIDISGLQHIIEILGAQLESLHLENCVRLTGGRILPLIQEKCPNLRILSLSGTNIRKIHIEKLQAGCPKLRTLLLANLLLNSTPKSNEKKANGFPDLVHVDLSGWYYGMQCRNDQFLKRILFSSHSLESLIIRGPNMITADGFKSLPDCPLKKLIFNNASFSKVAAVVEKWHNTLESLDISCNRGVDDECMELLSNFGLPKLRELDLNNTNISSDGLRSALNGCPNLEMLNLLSCRGLPRRVKTLLGEQEIQSLPMMLAEAEESD